MIAALRAALDGKAKPPGSLGRLEDLALQLGLLQDTRQPRVVDPVVLLFAADHGAASEVSAYPQSVTAAMLRAYLQGRAAINAFARLAGARLMLVDAGVAETLPLHPNLLSVKLGFGTADWTSGPAMPPAHVARAFHHAAAIVDELADRGTTVLALAEMGIGNTASASLLVHKVAGLPLRAGRGAGLDDAGLARKQARMDAAAARTGPLVSEAALAEYGGYEIAMLAAAIRQAARRRVCVVVDGVVVTAAAILAHGLDPSVLDACVFAHRSADATHAAMLEHLGATPLLDLGMRLGEGTGAALAIPLLRAAAAILTDMADLADLA